MKKVTKGANAKVATAQKAKSPKAIANAAVPAAKLQVVKGDKPKAEEAQPAEKTKIELKQSVTMRNVEATEHIVEDLYTRVVHRRRFNETINRLDKFTFDLKDTVDHDKENYYSGCGLTIKDSKGNEFVTRNPKLIQKIALFTRNLCIEKLAEIEAEIVLPAAA